MPRDSERWWEFDEEVDDPTARKVAGNCDTCANEIEVDGHQSWCPHSKEK